MTSGGASVKALYARLPNGGKPSVGAAGEFTVLAGVILRRGHSGEEVVLSLATGTKCAGVGVVEGEGKEAGAVVSDSHAETLARRGLHRYLFKSLIAELRGLSQVDGGILELVPDTGKFRLRKGFELVLYVSDSPCGDASIYARGTTMSFTGAKPVLGTVIREDVQSLGAVRTKSGRSDMPEEHRTSSMSCSDKLARWAHLGVQGALLSSFLETTFFSEVVVDADPAAQPGAQETSLHRALCGRCAPTATSPRVYVSEPISESSCPAFASGKCQIEHARRCSQGEKPRPSGTSINWVRDVVLEASPDSSGSRDSVESLRKKCTRVAGGTVEVTLAHTGTLQGAVKRCVGEAKNSSRLCKREMGRLLGVLLREPALYRLQLPELVRGSGMSFAHSQTYLWWKRADPEYVSRRDAFLASEPFTAWIQDPAPHFIVGEAEIQKDQEDKDKEKERKKIRVDIT